MPFLEEPLFGRSKVNTTRTKPSTFEECPRKLEEHLEWKRSGIQHCGAKSVGIEFVCVCVCVSLFFCEGTLSGFFQGNSKETSSFFPGQVSEVRQTVQPVVHLGHRWRHFGCSHSQILTAIFVWVCVKAGFGPEQLVQFSCLFAFELSKSREINQRVPKKHPLSPKGAELTNIFSCLTVEASQFDCGSTGILTVDPRNGLRWLFGPLKHPRKAYGPARNRAQHSSSSSGLKVLSRPLSALLVDGYWFLVAKGCSLKRDSSKNGSMRICRRVWVCCL